MEHQLSPPLTPCWLCGLMGSIIGVRVSVTCLDLPEYSFYNPLCALVISGVLNCPVSILRGKLSVGSMQLPHLRGK